AAGSRLLQARKVRLPLLADLHNALPGLQQPWLSTAQPGVNNTFYISILFPLLTFTVPSSQVPTGDIGRSPGLFSSNFLICLLKQSLLPTQLVVEPQQEILALPCLSLTPAF